MSDRLSPTWVPKLSKEEEANLHRLRIRKIGEHTVHDGAGTARWIDLVGMVGEDNQDETETVGPPARVGRHRAAVEVGQVLAIAHATARGQQGEVIEILEKGHTHQNVPLIAVV